MLEWLHLELGRVASGMEGREGRRLWRFQWPLTMISALICLYSGEQVQDYWTKLGTRIPKGKGVLEYVWAKVHTCVRSCCSISRFIVNSFLAFFHGLTNLWTVIWKRKWSFLLLFLKNSNPTFLPHTREEVRRYQEDKGTIQISQLISYLGTKMRSKMRGLGELIVPSLLVLKAVLCH